MASTVVGSNLTVRITEIINLKGQNQGTSNSLADLISSIDRIPPAT